MTTRQMTPSEVAETCDILSYHPHANIVGLCNGSARILYDGFTNNDRAKPGGMVYVHSLIPEPRFLTKGFLREMWRFPFEVVDWVIGVTPAFNTRALDFNRRIGFKPALILPNGYAPGIDLWWQAVHHSACRYYKRPQEQIL